MKVTELLPWPYWIVAVYAQSHYFSTNSDDNLDLIDSKTKHTICVIVISGL